MQKTVEIEVGGGSLKIETNRWARQSNGSALLTYKDNMVLVTTNMKENPREERDFLPLMVDFRENTYAAGKIPGGYFKREGKPSEKEVLLSRLIDRPIRPLFPNNYFHETQVIALLFSADFSVDYDAMGIIGASASLLSSTIPFKTPVGAVKIGLKDNQYLINPAYDKLRDLDMSLMVAGTEKNIVMIEASGNEISEEAIFEGIKLAKDIIGTICNSQKELINPEKLAVEENTDVIEKTRTIESKYHEKIKDSVFSKDRLERNLKLEAIFEEITDGIEDEIEIARFKTALHNVEYDIFRSTLLKERRRTDGRGIEEIRPITIELGVFPRVHGSAVFTRGETQALATVTLGTEEDAQRLDPLNGEDAAKKFMLHYNFPPFSVGEVSFLRGAGRREIGHGNLAEKALSPVMPDEKEFPYTIRLVSDILESNGSSSMATVCGATLALMDAGVPIREPVAGIAMGLVKEDKDFLVLTDIAGLEDHFGDMDFKVAGTKRGITAIQMDIKIDGLNDEIIQQALEDAKKVRLFILEKMKETIPVPSKELSEFAPVILTHKINADKIKDLIGPGGKNIKDLITTYNVKINAAQDGKVTIAASSKEIGQKVIEKIKELTGAVELHKIYKGKITRIEDYGLFVEIFPNATGLVHISEVSNKRVDNLRRMFRIGQPIDVKVIGFDRDNKIKLSKKFAEPQYHGNNKNSQTDET